jgi:hypothetical protein
VTEVLLQRVGFGLRPFLGEEPLLFDVESVDEVACQLGLLFHQQLNLALAEFGAIEFIESAAVVNCILWLDGGEHGVLVQEGGDMEGEFVDERISGFEIDWKEE